MWPVPKWVTGRLLMTYKVGEEARCRNNRARANALQAVSRDRFKFIGDVGFRLQPSRSYLPVWVTRRRKAGSAMRENQHTIY